MTFSFSPLNIFPEMLCECLLSLMVALMEEFTPHQEFLGSPEEKCVWGIFSARGKFSGKFDSQVVELHQEKEAVDLETVLGVSYYGYRYLDVEQGRCLRRDPIGEGGGMVLLGIALLSAGYCRASTWNFNPHFE